MRPVGEVEHRENLLDFVNWATGVSTAERARESASPCRNQDASGSRQANNIGSVQSSQNTLGGEVKSFGETESQEKTQV